MAAEFLQPSLFCSDINEKTLLSVHADDLDEGYVLVTCEAFIKRYNIAHRRPENSWSTKTWDPFTCGAIRNGSTGNISTVIDRVSFCEWSLEQNDISDIKRQKFKSPIYSLVVSGTNIYIVFINGCIQLLETALASRKSPKEGVKRDDEKILTTKIFENNSYQTNFALLLQGKGGDLRVCLDSGYSGSSPSYIDFSHQSHKLLASTFLASGSLFTLWSDGNLYSFDVRSESSSTLPGTVQGSLSTINTMKNANILELSSTHIAIQAMNVNQEGGILLLWDLKFGLCMSSTTLKLYRDPPLLWNIGSGVIAGQGFSLCLVPYDIRPSNLASILGAKISDKNIPPTKHIDSSDWSTGTTIPKSEKMSNGSSHMEKSQGIRDQMKKLPSSSLSEDIISRQVVKEVILSGNSELVYNCLCDFSIIPEKSLLAILKYFLEISEDFFTQHLGRPSGGMLLTNCPVSTGLEATQSTEGLVAPFSDRKSAVINQILCKPFTAKIMAGQLPLLGFSSSLQLMDHLHYFIMEGEVDLVPSKNPSSPSLECACLWLCLLLDANYHQLVMTSEVDIQKKLLAWLNNVASLKSSIEAFSDLDPLIERILNEKPVPTHKENAPYSVERLILL